MLKNNLLSPTNFERNDSELQEWLLLCIFVAGKSSKTQAAKLEDFLEVLGRPEHPISHLVYMTKDEILKALHESMTGQYKRLATCLYELSRANLNLRTCTTSDLEAIHGIGMKTSRFFAVYSRENFKAAILDVHILSWLREIGIPAPKSTPTGRKYLTFEAIYLREAEARGLTDFQVWESRQKSW